MRDDDLQPGALFDGRYVLDRRLGRGGAGTVWLARDVVEGEALVAVKVLLAEVHSHPRAVERFAREARLLAELVHPNIAKAVRFSVSDASAYLVMEYVPGRSLAVDIGRHCVAASHFDVATVLRRVEAIAAGLGHAHERRVVHRDMKPHNVLLADEGASEVVKVVDFGIAKILDSDFHDSTTLGRRLGSTMYMSPEQVRGEAADTRSDVFALGCLAFELLTLRRAWARDDQGRPYPAFDRPLRDSSANEVPDVMRRIVTEARPQPSQWRDGLPLAVDDVIARALAIRSVDRYGTVQALVDDLVAALPADTRVELAAESLLAPDEQVPSAVAALLEAAPTVAQTVPEAPGPNAAGPGPLTPATVRAAWGWAAAAVVAVAALGVVGFVALEDPASVVLRPAAMEGGPAAVGPSAVKPLRARGPAESASISETATELAPIDAKDRPRRKTRAAGRSGARNRAPREPAPATAEPPTKDGTVQTLRRLLERVKANPEDAALYDRLATVLTRASERLPVPADARRIKRIVASSTMVGDVEGLELGLRALEAARGR